MLALLGSAPDAALFLFLLVEGLLLAAGGLLCRWLAGLALGTAASTGPGDADGLDGSQHEDPNFLTAPLFASSFCFTF